MSPIEAVVSHNPMGSGTPHYMNVFIPISSHDSCNQININQSVSYKIVFDYRLFFASYQLINSNVVNFYLPYSRVWHF